MSPSHLVRHQACNSFCQAWIWYSSKLLSVICCRTLYHWMQTHCQMKAVANSASSNVVRVFLMTLIKQVVLLSSDNIVFKRLKPVIWVIIFSKFLFSENTTRTCNFDWHERDKIKIHRGFALTNYFFKHDKLSNLFI